MSARPAAGNIRLIALVLATIAIQIVVALMLKELADDHGPDSLLWMGFVLCAAMGLNVLRFAVWAYTHQHYPLSHSYPLTALFFPCILALSAWYGDPVSSRELLGVGLIMTGVGLMNWDRDDDG